MLRFGKYKGKTYEHVYRMDKGYCAWFVENCKQGKDFKKFITDRGLFNKASIVGKRTTASALAKKISMDPEIRMFVAELWEKELDLDGESDQLVDLDGESDQLVDPPVDLDGESDQLVDPPVDPLVDLDGESDQLVDPPVDLNKKNTNRVIANPKRNITPQLYGQFVDYFVRYRLSQEMNVLFKDRATSTIIKKQLPGWEVVSKAMEFLNDPFDRDESRLNPLVFHNILRCASAHSIAFDGRKSKTQRVMMELDDSVVSRIDSFIETMLPKNIKPSFTGILQNPNISGNHISADADLIFGDTIVDIKTGKDDFVYYTVQLLIYAVLYQDLYETEVKVLLIFNPCIEDHTITLTLQDGVLNRFSEYLKKLKLL